MNTKPVDGKAIRQKRMNQALSASQLAKLIGVTDGKIYKWEEGTTPRTHGDYKKITNWLNGIGPVVAQHKPVQVKKVIKPTNGTVPSEDFKKKYYDLLEKYTALLEKQNL